MQVIKPGFVYLLPNAGRQNETGQLLHFIELGEDPDAIANDGTDASEVIKALIEKLNYEHSQVPSENYTHAINSLEDALFSLSGALPPLAVAPDVPENTEGPAPGEAEGPDVVNQPAP